MRRLMTLGFCLLCLFATSTALAVSASAASPGAVAAWGANSEGQLGNGSTVNSRDPAPVSGLAGVKAISGGGNHSLALLGNGTVAAWGENKAGQLGNGSTTASHVPVAVTGLSGVVAIAAGEEHSLALLSNGTVMAWGNNANGQLGDGSIVSSDVPVAVTGLSGVVAISAGALHSLALLSNGTVMAWGADSFGQLGNGTTGTGQVVPVSVTGLAGVTAIAAGGYHSLALLGNGTVMAWGDGAKGELGNGSTTSSDLPVAVKELTGVTAIAGGEYHSLALLSGGTVMAWGDNARGELGNASMTNTDAPVAVASLTGVTAISAGHNFSLALLGNGTVAAWGSNAEGQLGDGLTAGSDVPVVSPSIDEVKGISAGGLHSLAEGPLLPTVTNVSPSAGPPAGSTPVTITGTDFTGASAVKFGANNAVSFKVESATTITAVSPAGVGAVDVRVTVAEGTSPASSADQFSYLPTVTGVSPAKGPEAGGTAVTITGTNLTGATAVKFAANNAVSFKVESATTITAISPAGLGTVDVTVTTPGGTSVTGAADRFSYAEAAPELGRCVKVAKGGVGAYSDKGCTVGSATGGYEWEPGPGAKPKFESKVKKSKPIALQTVGGAEVSCGSEKGSGEYSGPKAIVNVVISFTGCTIGHTKCSSAGAKEGTLETKTLTGLLGIIKKGTEASQDEIGFDLKAASAGPLLEFACGGVGQVWSGSVIVPIKANAMSSSAQLTFAAKSGRQEPEQFEGQPKDILESSVGGGSLEQSALTLTTTLKSKEKIEVNSVV